MIFASDLDQTLIYSRKSFRAHIEDNSIQLIETLDGKEISFITYKTITLLIKLQLHSYFIPVTTRTIEQFQRITLFQNEIILNMPLQVTAVISFITVSKMLLGTKK